jgi:hypothetical protein
MTAPPCLPGFLAATVESARQTLWRLLRWRSVLWLCLLAPLVLAIVGWMIGGRDLGRIDGRGAYCMLAWWLHASVLMPWLCTFLGVRAVHAPLEDRTFQYLFLRPVARSALLLGAWFAAALVGAAVSACWATALFVGVSRHEALWPNGPEWQLVQVFASGGALAGAAYAAAAALFATALRRPLLWAAVFVVGLQQLTANLPVSAGLRQLTLADPLRRFVLDGIEPGRDLARALWPQETSWREELVGEPGWELVRFGGICLLLAAITYSRTDYDARPRD